MFSITVLGSLLLSTLALAAPSTNEVKARQNGEIEMSGHGLETNMSSDIPLLCLEGCVTPLENYFYCLNGSTLDIEPGEQSGACDNLCTQTVYDNLVACLECNLANGADYPRTEVQEKLTKTNEYCANSNRAINNVIESLSLTATATGPFETSFSGVNATLATWTGLVPYVTDEAGAVTQTPGPAGTAASSASGAASSAASAATAAASSAAGAASSAAASAAQTSNAAVPGGSVNFAGMGGILAVAGWILT